MIRPCVLFDPSIRSRFEDVRRRTHPVSSLTKALGGEAKVIKVRLGLAHFNTCETRVLIGRIFAPSQPVLVQVCLQIVAQRTQQRAYKTNAVALKHLRHRRKPIHARTTRETHQETFCDIVLGMS